MWINSEFNLVNIILAPTRVCSSRIIRCPASGMLLQSIWYPRLQITRWELLTVGPCHEPGCLSAGLALLPELIVILSDCFHRSCKRRFGSRNTRTRFVLVETEHIFIDSSGNKILWNSDVSHLGHTTDWTITFVDLTEDESDFKLILEGTIPAGYPDARICVDNITSYTEPCSALQQASTKATSQWVWAQYFGITFITALILGLTIPILFLVILIWVCRRRHHSLNSPYTNNKLFSTNLWYYIGGKEIGDDPTGFRGSASLVRSNKHYNNNSSGMGTLLNGTSQFGPEVMDLPDVVIPGGRVVSFNYSGNTLGPGGTLRHASQTGSPAPVQPANCFGHGQLTQQMGTVSSQSSSTPSTTVARPTNLAPVNDGVFSSETGYPYQQNQQAFGVPGQPSMMMTQSVAPGYGIDVHGSQFTDASNGMLSGIGQYNTYAPSMSTMTQPQPGTQQQFTQPQPPVPAFQPAPYAQPLQQTAFAPLPIQTQQQQMQTQQQPIQSELAGQQLQPQRVLQQTLPPPPSPLPQPPPQQAVASVAQQQPQQQQQQITDKVAFYIQPPTSSSVRQGAIKVDSATTAEAFTNQQAAMAALFAATEESEGRHEARPNAIATNGNTDVYMDANQTAMRREDHPPPGYDEAVGLVVSRPSQNAGYFNQHANMVLSHNTMAKPAVPVPNSATTPTPPALPPRRMVNEIGLDDIEDTQPTACLSLAERYGLPVAEI
ncbi:hypothetical protein AHF37_07504 [Paragonimus kellicotti]|nr:hypothetical protein AHF37_07504 [Paragonimus kellicotti]